ncbi:phosphatase [Virgisporangium aliadipatigenens]|uniref:Phosphatase n=1 Tax=Virgisporangium aliadipatigenens TaxID=741659 RepID=A0A8J4DT13_9ACTN|nr:PP2C family protein-serine/threonine phosphatase [Virgisporangium aliadipatigenens]GIJ49314.1 phosphatase [Virgisporangium aliadipatigenens]
MVMPERTSWRAAIVDLLARSRLAQPDRYPIEVNNALAGLGVRTAIYLVDHEQRTLHAVPEPGRAAGPSLDVATTEAGRAFMHTEVVRVRPGRLWMPLLDGAERLGVLRVDADRHAVADPRFAEQLDLFAALVGHLLVGKLPYGDGLSSVRRTRPMSPAAELLWHLLPPLTYACERFAVAAVLEPCYEVGGDGFDYAVGGDGTFLTVLDTTGHGLPAGLGTAVALAAMRSARRDGRRLEELPATVDAALLEQFTDMRFTTGVLAELDLDTGLLRYINAGHPPPLVLRGASVVGRLDGGRRLPLGLDSPPAVPAEMMLEPGDRLLCFTDGVTEARDRTGAHFGEERLAELAERHAAEGLPAPETLRRLSHAVLDHLDGPPTDDATMLLVEWSKGAARRILPQG